MILHYLISKKNIYIIYAYVQYTDGTGKIRYFCGNTEMIRGFLENIF